MNADIQRTVLVDVNRDCPIRDINNLLVTIICSFYQASIHIHVHIPINDRTRFSLHNIVRSALCLTVPSIPNHYTQSFPFFRYIRIHVSPILDR